MSLMDILNKVMSLVSLFLSGSHAFFLFFLSNFSLYLLPINLQL